MNSRGPDEASTCCGEDTGRLRLRLWRIVPRGIRSETGTGTTTTTTSEEDRLLDEKEARAIARVLNAGPIATKDAAVLFQLARRTRSVEPYSGVDEAVVDAATDLFARAAAAGKPRPGNKTVLNHVRETLGLSLTTRELERVVTAVDAVDPAEERLNRRSEGEFL